MDAHHHRFRGYRICTDNDFNPIRLPAPADEEVWLAAVPGENRLVEIHEVSIAGEVRAQQAAARLEKMRALANPVFPILLENGMEAGKLFYVTSFREAEMVTDYAGRVGPVPELAALTLISELLEALSELQDDPDSLSLPRIDRAALVLRHGYRLDLCIGSLSLAHEPCENVEREAFLRIGSALELLHLLLTGRQIDLGLQIASGKKDDLPLLVSELLDEALNRGTDESLDITTFKEVIEARIGEGGRHAWQGQLSLPHGPLRGLLPSEDKLHTGLGDSYEFEDADLIFRSPFTFEMSDRNTREQMRLQILPPPKMLGRNHYPAGMLSASDVPEPAQSHFVEVERIMDDPCLVCVIEKGDNGFSLATLLRIRGRLSTGDAYILLKAIDGVLSRIEGSWDGDPSLHPRNIQLRFASDVDCSSLLTESAIGSWPAFDVQIRKHPTIDAFCNGSSAITHRFGSLACELLTGCENAPLAESQRFHDELTALPAEALDGSRASRENLLERFVGQVWQDEQARRSPECATEGQPTRDAGSWVFPAAFQSMSPALDPAPAVGPKSSSLMDKMRAGLERIKRSSSKRSHREIPETNGRREPSTPVAGLPATPTSPFSSLPNVPPAPEVAPSCEMAKTEKDSAEAPVMEDPAAAATNGDRENARTRGEEPFSSSHNPWSDPDSPIRSLRSDEEFDESTFEPGAGKPDGRRAILIPATILFILVLLGVAMLIEWRSGTKGTPAPKDTPSPTATEENSVQPQEKKLLLQNDKSDLPVEVRLTRISALSGAGNPNAALHGLAKLCVSQEMTPGILAVLEDVLKAHARQLKPAAFDPDTLSMLERSAMTDHIPSILALGEHFKKTNRERAEHWFLLAIEKGNSSEAMVEAGMLYAKGLGAHGKPMLKRAAQWFAQAHALNNVEGTYHFAECLLYGRGVDRDTKLALTMLREASVANHAPASHLLGDCYLEGVGNEPDYAQARIFYELAADLGHTDSIASIGWLYMKGLGIRQDRVKGAAYFKSGAGKGNAQCMFYYGLCLENGLGTEQDWDAARNWVVRAAIAGNDSAVAWCKENQVQYQETASVN